MDVIKFFAGDWGALRFLAGFVLLPFLYLRDCSDIYQSYQSFLDKLSDNDLPQADQNATLLRLQDKLHFFDMEWWLVAAITMLLLGIFLLGEVAQYSSLTLPGQVAAKGSVSDPPTVATTETAAENSRPEEKGREQVESTSGEVQQAKGIMNVFGFIVALAVTYCVHWRKADVYRTFAELAWEKARSGETTR